MVKGLNAHLQDMSDGNSEHPNVPNVPQCLGISWHCAFYVYPCFLQVIRCWLCVRVRLSYSQSLAPTILSILYYRYTPLHSVNYVIHSIYMVSNTLHNSPETETLELSKPSHQRHSKHKPDASRRTRTRTGGHLGIAGSEAKPMEIMENMLF